MTPSQDRAITSAIADWGTRLTPTQRAAIRTSPARVTLQVRLDDHIHARLLEMALGEHRSLNGQINHALDMWLKVQPRKAVR